MRAPHRGRYLRRPRLAAGRRGPAATMSNLLGRGTDSAQFLTRCSRGAWATPESNTSSRGAFTGGSARSTRCPAATRCARRRSGTDPNRRDTRGCSCAATTCSIRRSTACSTRPTSSRIKSPGTSTRGSPPPRRSRSCPSRPSRDVPSFSSRSSQVEGTESAAASTARLGPPAVPRNSRTQEHHARSLNLRRRAESSSGGSALHPTPSRRGACVARSSTRAPCMSGGRDRCGSRECPCAASTRPERTVKTSCSLGQARPPRRSSGATGPPHPTPTRRRSM